MLGPGHPPAAVQGAAAAARRARRADAGLRRAAARARRRGRPRGADRRALPRARSDATPSSTRSSAAWRALAEGAGLEVCLATYFAGLRGRALDEVLDAPRGRGPPRPRARAGAARPRRSTASPGRRPGSRSASSTAATSGRPTSTPPCGQLDAAVAALGEDRVTIAPSCSLLHVPYSVAREASIPPRCAGGSSSPRSGSPSWGSSRPRSRRPGSATPCWRSPAGSPRGAG